MQLIRACLILLALLGQPWTKHATREHERIDMATPIWISSDGDWGNTASWSTASVPVANDTVVFDGVNSVVSVTGGLNQTGINLDELQISPAYTGDIGLLGNPLIIDCAKLVHRGAGTLYHKADGGINRILVDSRNLVNAAQFSGSASSWRTAVKKGRVTCTNGLSDMAVLSVVGDKSIVIVEANGAESIGAVYQSGGFIQNFRPIDTSVRKAVISGGTFVHESGAIYTLVVNGGFVEYNAGETLTEGFLLAGTLDYTRSGNTKAALLMEVFPGAELLTTTQTTISVLLDYRKEIP
ncbi:hypothetical protein LCGC14_1936570 [marine sediment metagenome]|uniref:G8 domain-containing protein n=1 Tax=marine sediment metagenome TaxID=412755 RepID=A0A0F9FLL5_9ZZZZ